jgi:hypothetical protein
MNRKAFSLSITLWMSAALIAGSVYFLKINKENVTIASSLDDKLLSSIEMYSTLELLKHYLILGKFDKNKIKIGKQQFFPFSLPIDSTPFKYKHSTIMLQDTAGLINTMYPYPVAPYAIKILKGEEQFEIANDSLLDWIDSNDFHKVNGAEHFFTNKMATIIPLEIKVIYIIMMS